MQNRAGSWSHAKKTKPKQNKKTPLPQIEQAKAIEEDVRVLGHLTCLKEEWNHQVRRKAGFKNHEKGDIALLGFPFYLP